MVHVLTREWANVVDATLGHNHHPVVDPTDASTHWISEVRRQDAGAISRHVRSVPGKSHRVKGHDRCRVRYWGLGWSTQE